MAKAFKVDKHGFPRGRLDLFAVVSYSYTENATYIHAIDRNEAMANAHVIAVKDNYRLKDKRARVWHERCESDHLFAALFRIA